MDSSFFPCWLIARPSAMVFVFPGLVEKKKKKRKKKPPGGEWTPSLGRL